jgi:phenylacetic acid degradation operon negative regulatory protein
MTPPVKLDAAVATHLARLIADRPPRAGSLVVTVFGDAVVPHGGAIWLGSLIRWLANFGVQERAVRTAVHRLTADDWFTVTSSGRRSDYRLTRASRHRFADAERRIYAAAPSSWDETWWIVVLGHGTVGVEARDRARRELRWHGFGELAPTVLVHPSADVAELALALADLGLRRHAIVLRARGDDRLPGGPASVRELVASAWDLRHLAAEYRAYVRRFTPFAERLAAGAIVSPETCFQLRVFAIHEYRRILLRDPELPAELLPERWVGAEARRICAAIYRAVEAPAAAFLRTSGEVGGRTLPSPVRWYFRRFGGLHSSPRGVAN